MKVAIYWCKMTKYSNINHSYIILAFYTAIIWTHHSSLPIFFLVVVFYCKCWHLSILLFISNQVHICYCHTKEVITVKVDEAILNILSTFMNKIAYWWLAHPTYVVAIYTTYLTWLGVSSHYQMTKHFSEIFPYHHIVYLPDDLCALTFWRFWNWWCCCHRFTTLVCLSFSD